MIREKPFFLLILLISFTHIFGQIIVKKSGENPSIQNAIDIASPGDTIFVEKGIYHEFDISIDKPLTLIGLNFPVIDAEEKGYILSITADSVTISGFKLINVGKSYTKDYSAIHTYRINNFVIENNIFENPFFAIHIEKSKNGVIKNNTIFGNAKEEHSSGNGIHLWHSSKIEVTGNKIEKMRDGIYF